MKNWTPRLLTLIGSLTAGLIPAPALGWGAEGHRIVAAIAADELTPTARSQVEQLLGTDALVGMMTASTWADEIRQKRPDTAPWHFTDIPVQSDRFDSQRDCPRDNCVVGQIDRDARIVADRQLAAPVRAEALRFLIHFVADVHQPLHAADNNDRGGNRVRVLLRRHHTNLHAVWDVDVVRALGHSPEEVSVQLEREITPTRRRAWAAGTARDWANEAHQIARREVYGQLSGQGGTDAEIIFPADYARAERNVADVQLEKAGVRLAAVLNKALR
jgi:nuclease S1